VAAVVVLVAAGLAASLVVSHKLSSRQIVLPFTGLDGPRVAVDSASAVYATDSGNNPVLKLPAR
jgi:hypothetical protein